MRKIIIGLILILGLANIAAIDSNKEALKSIVTMSRAYTLQTWIVNLDASGNEIIYNPTPKFNFSPNNGNKIAKDQEHFLKVYFKSNVANSGVAVYTDNNNTLNLLPIANPKYNNDWGEDYDTTKLHRYTTPFGVYQAYPPELGAGLVYNYGSSNIRKAVPLVWAVFADMKDYTVIETGQKIPGAKNFVFDQQWTAPKEPNHATMQDPMRETWFNFVGSPQPDGNPKFTDMIDYRTVIRWGNGNPNGDLLSLAGRDANRNGVYEESEFEYDTNHTIYVTFAADFREGGIQGSYSTNRIIVELYQK